MGRLTERDKHGQGIWVEEIHGNYNFFDKYGDMYPAIDKLAHYEDLEEQGRLIELPFPLDTEKVFYINTKHSEIFEIECDDVWIEPREDVEAFYYIGDFVFIKEDFGLKVFLTEEEALAKLKELEEHHFTDVDKMGKE